MNNELFLSALLGLIVGGAIDSGNICVVRAARDLVHGKPDMAVSNLCTSACAAIVFFITVKLGLLRHAAIWSYPNLMTFLGATLFALGGIVNGACAVGTVGRLARGDIGSLATLLGALLVALLIPRTVVANQSPDLAALAGSTWLAIMLGFTALAMIVSWQHLRLRRLGSYAVLGVAASILTNLQGDWTRLSVMQAAHIDMPLHYAAIACLSAVLLGALLAALATGHFRFIRPDPRIMAQEAVGGGLMAAGAILIPGGNDTLLIFGVPSGNPNAITAYAIMFAIMMMVAQWRDSRHPPISG